MANEPPSKEAHHPRTSLITAAVTRLSAFPASLSGASRIIREVPGIRFFALAASAFRCYLSTLFLSQAGESASSPFALFHVIRHIRAYDYPAS